ncbi:peptidoglycan bridge formation glycyltransferase FemA/FemB family protein [Candidatus Saccharibacteria bacterium]|nr:peptidoglycan bridge formation glycyltransferase FemA/FemB family protein [Candidatus Saccharibacteria bacterium]
MYKHFLQSPSWKKFQETEGKTVFEENASDFSFLAILETTKLGNYLYLPYGPALSKNSPKSALKHALSSLKSLAKANNCFFIRIEPTEFFSEKYLSSLGLKKSKELNPAHTWVLDLTDSPETILTNMSQGTRTRHNQFKKKGLSVEVTTDAEEIKHLTRLQHKLAKEKGINTFSNSYLKNELAQPFASLYLVHYSENPNVPQPNVPDSKTAQKSSKSPDNSDKIISASLFFDDKENQTRYYMQSATDSDYKKLPATVGLLTASIFDAKEKGLKFFDFWGIAPENAPKSHPWSGFTAFKKSFGGFAKTYSGTYDLPIKKAKYSLYKLLRKLNLALRKI